MISVVIPTLQKNTKVFYNLLDTLIEDPSVGEIIVIDNSLKGLDYSDSKLRVITPQENLYVNPSWNLGVKEAKYEIVALLNDDIAIPNNFCSNVANQMNSSMGIVGMHSLDCTALLEDIKNPPNTNLILEKTRYMDSGFGTAMFFYKQNYYYIPESIKIVYGDVWLVYNTRKNGYPTYRVTNQNIYHLGSLSSSEKRFNPICANDAKIYKSLTIKWYNRLLSFDECWDCYKIRILGLTLKIKKRNSRGVINDK